MVMRTATTAPIVDDPDLLEPAVPGSAVELEAAELADVLEMLMINDEVLLCEDSEADVTTAAVVEGEEVARIEEDKEAAGIEGDEEVAGIEGDEGVTKGTGRMEGGSVVREEIVEELGCSPPRPVGTGRSPLMISVGSKPVGSKPVGSITLGSISPKVKRPAFRASTLRSLR
jgi:hypothetical protein